MTPEQTRVLSIALENLGAPSDADALMAARVAAHLIQAKGVPHIAIAGAIAACITTKTKVLPARGFAELGPRATRKRVIALGRQRGRTAEDKARLADMRQRLERDARPDFSAEEIEWLDGLWRAANPGIAAEG